MHYAGAALTDKVRRRSTPLSACIFGKKVFCEPEKAYCSGSEWRLRMIIALELDPLRILSI